MAEYMREVPRQKIKAGEKHICPECFHYRVCMGRVNRPCIECDCYIPAADVRENVKAEWIDREVFTANGNVDMLQSAFCPNCKRYHTTPYSYYFTNYEFCPNCGAKMEVGC